MPHYLSNRGKLLLMQGKWDTAGATALKAGLLTGSAIPAAIDTQAEINTLNTVGEFLALTGVDEPTMTWYTSTGSAGRQSFTRTNASEDDTNHRVNMDASDLTWNSAASGADTHIYGGFWYDGTTDTNDTTRLFMGVFLFSSALALNGSNITLAIADLVRAA